ncbi:Hypothetical predicted protein, partial [Mytilus galloprovincialis]
MDINVITPSVQIHYRELHGWLLYHVAMKTVAKALCVFQLLFKGSLADYNLYKRSDILGKAEVLNHLKDALTKFTLKYKMFGLPPNALHTNLSPSTAPVKVNVFPSDFDYKKGRVSSVKNTAFSFQTKRKKYHSTR